METPAYVQPKIYSSVLDVIGHTPLVRLNRIPKMEGVQCEILAKCEFMNPTGSHKDRLALNLIKSAEARGDIKPGGAIVEASSGNTGLSLSFVSSMKDYKAIIAVTPKTSQEKIDLMRGFGADVIKAKSNASKASDGVFALAKDLAKETKNSFYTDQFYNPDNPQTHVLGTAVEIANQCDNKCNYFFMAAGTGGTITGIGKTLKAKIPGVKVIGCDPVGSLIGSTGAFYIPFKVEGVGYDFVPGNCDLKVMDEWMKFEDKAAFDFARRLMREEGLMCGGSAGGILWCAIEFAKKNKLTKNDRLVVILPDTNRNYLTKYVSDAWYLENGFFNEDEYRKEAIPPTESRLGDNGTVKEMTLSEVPILGLTEKIGAAFELLKKNPILMIASKAGDAKSIKGVVASKDILYYVSTKKATFSDTVEKVMRSDISPFSNAIKLSTASKLLETREFILCKSETSVYYVTAKDIMEKLASIEASMSALKIQ